jgi:HK97 family phage portal protein
MILKTTRGDREYRMAEFGSSAIPSYSSTWSTWTGTPVSMGDVVGLPAVALAIRRVSSSLASFYLGCYQGRGANRKEVMESPQGKLLRRPWEGLNRFNWKADMSASVESCGNAVAQKVKVRGQVVGLRPIDMDYVSIEDEKGEKVFKIRTTQGTKTYTSTDIWHLRGPTIKGGIVGYSPITLHRNALGVTVDRNRFVGRHFQNDARPGVALLFPQGITTTQAREWRDEWDANHAGSDNRGRTGALGGGATIQTFPLSLEDEQFVEQVRLSVEDVARIWDIPLALMLIPGDATGGTTEQDWLRFNQMTMRPRLLNFEDELEADGDIFGETELYPEFTTDQTAWIDAITRANVEHMHLQSGLRYPDEIRAEHGWPPLPDELGKLPQITPVGGAPNTDPPAAQTNGKGDPAAVAAP